MVLESFSLKPAGLACRPTRLVNKSREAAIKSSRGCGLKSEISVSYPNGSVDCSPLFRYYTAI